MPRRRIGQETLFQDAPKHSPPDEITGLVDWAVIAARLEAIHASPKGEASWPPLAMFRALLLSVWYDLSDVKLAEALDDRASFRRFCGFGRAEPTPERTAFVRFRRELVCHGLDEALFEDITRQLEAQAVTVKTGTLADVEPLERHGPRDNGEAEQWLADWNGAIHRVRGRIGKIFGTWKRSCGFRRMRWRGLSKARLQTHLTAIAYNLKRTLSILTRARKAVSSRRQPADRSASAGNSLENTQEIDIRAQVS